MTQKSARTRRDETSSPIPKPNALGDFIVVSLMYFAIALIFYALKADHDYLLLYLAMIAVVALAVKITRASFGAAGKWVSKQFLGHLGDPLKKKTSVRACSPFEPHHHHSCNLLLCRVVEKMARPELAIGHSQLHGTDGI